MDGEGKAISVEFVGKVAVIVMRRGENRINLQFLKQFNEALDVVERNSEVTAMITTGEGKFFCNGIDLNWVLSLNKDSKAGSERSINKMREDFEGLLRRLLLFPLPTISSINGHAYAAGLLLALSHDFRLMNSTQGWLCLNEVHIGLFFSPFLLALLQLKLTKSIFPDAVIMGVTFDSKKALAEKLVHNVAPAELLLTKALNFAKQQTIKPYDRTILREMKRQCYKELMAISKL